jgi:hypothetical protein
VILIITNKGDIHCNPVIKHLQRNGDKYFRLNTESLLTDYLISFSYKDQSADLHIENKINGKTLSSKEVISVWERRPNSPVLPEISNEKIKLVVEDEANELTKWIRHFFINCRMIGSSVWDRPNESKLRQMDVASKVINELRSEIKLPHTLLTNSKKDLEQFSNNKKEIVLKPISADGLMLDDKLEIPFTSRKVNSKNINVITQDDLELCPSFMQEYVEKNYELRITVIGEKILCCKIDL